MKKLNKRKIRWIVQEVERRETGLYTIAKTQNINPNIFVKFIENLEIKNQNFFLVEENQIQ